MSPENSGGQTSPGAAGRQEGWRSRNQPLPGAVARERPEPWPGAVPAACRGLHTGQRRPERAGKPVPSCPRPSAPLVAPRGGVTAPRSPAAPTAGAAPAPPGSRLPTSGLPGSPPPPHHMAAPATGSRRKPEAAVTPPPPSPSAGRRPFASAFLPRRARSGTCRARAGLHPRGDARSPRGPPRPGGAGGRSWPVHS